MQQISFLGTLWSGRDILHHQRCSTILSWEIEPLYPRYYSYTPLIDQTLRGY